VDGGILLLAGIRDFGRSALIHAKFSYNNDRFLDHVDAGGESPVGDAAEEYGENNSFVTVSDSV
jgi:hypothetical protein